jgi:hypothetical protein
LRFSTFPFFFLGISALTLLPNSQPGKPDFQFVVRSPSGVKKNSWGLLSTISLPDNLGSLADNSPDWVALPAVRYRQQGHRAVPPSQPPQV